jgi:hypothetical protein
MFLHFNIQKACKLVFVGIFFTISLQDCGSSHPPTVGTLTIDDDSVPFQNMSCSAALTLVNSTASGYTLAFLTATFTDDHNHTHHIELDQNQVADDFDPIAVNPGGISHGNVKFDLQNTDLVSPISANVIIIALAGQQVTHFVGNFTCRD